ncbi:hypothetical protein AAMO2058_000383800 [Amorphochlora amoebiformis]
MPITPKLNWEQSESDVTLTVHIKHALKSKLSITSSPLFLKVNHKPYLLDLDLNKEILYSDIRVTIMPEYIKINCPKEKKVEWEALRAIGDKESLKKRREESVSQAEQARYKHLQRVKEEKKDAQEKALRSHWAVQDKHKKAVEDLKQRDIQLGKEEIANFAGKFTKNLDEKPEDHDKPKSPSDLFTGGNESQEPKVKEIWATVPSAAATEKLENDYNLPAVRSSRTIEVVFTKNSRKGMPRRGDHNHELAEIRKKRKDMSGPLQEQAVFLKDKGDAFFRNGDFLAGVNAYSEAVQKDEEMVQCYSNRALCHFQIAEELIGQGKSPKILHHLRTCRSDCSTALALLENRKNLELTKDNRNKCTLKCLLLRSKISERLGEIQPAILDLGKSLNLMGKKDRAFRILEERLLGLDALTRTPVAKTPIHELIETITNGDTKIGDIAIRLYPLEPMVRILRSERLAETESEEAIKDATLALAALDQDSTHDANHKETSALLESLKRVKDRQHLRSRAFAARARGYSMLNQWSRAQEEFKSALELFPTHPGLQKATERAELMIRANGYLRRASSLYSRHQFVKSSRSLTAFLKHIPLPTAHIGVLCNRAGCWLAVKRYDDCIRDCTRALQLHDHLSKKEKDNKINTIDIKVAKSLH